MLRHVLINLLIIHQYSFEFIRDKKYFAIDDFNFNDSIFNDSTNCQPLDKEQYYLYNFDDSSTFRKLECMPESVAERNVYFPKCCPPNYVYEPTYHKCVENNTGDLLAEFSNNTVLIRTDLSECKVILDHTHLSGKVFLDSEGSLHLKDKSYQFGSYCLDNSNDLGNLVARTCEEVDVCKTQGITCIKKCCPDGQYYEGNRCYPGSQFGLSSKNISRFKDPPDYFNAVLVSETCSRYLDKPRYTFYIDKGGMTVIRELGVWKQYLLEENYYCVEYVRTAKIQEHKLLLCNLYDHVENASKPIVKKVALIISCVCLLVTVILYLILPDLKNFIGKIIILYCSCLFVAFSLLTWLQFDPVPGDYCDVFGFAIAFSFLAAFSWMTILSYEMWRVLGSMTTEYGNRLHTHKKRFLWYNIIGWSIPFGFITFTLFDYLYYFLPNPIHMTVGYRRCVFENNMSKGMYGYALQFAMPCGLYLLINLVIFIKTIRYVYHVKNEINHIKAVDSREKLNKWSILHTDKERVKMVVRIFLLMGVNFLFETISSIFVDFTKSKPLEIIEITFDTFNALQGVFILCIFLVKKKTWNLLKQMANLATSSRKSSIATGSTEVMASLRNHP